MIDPALKKGHHKLYRYDGQHFSLAVSSRRAFPPPPPTLGGAPRQRRTEGDPSPSHLANCQPGLPPLSLEWDWCLEGGLTLPLGRVPALPY